MSALPCSPECAESECQACFLTRRKAERRLRVEYAKLLAENWALKAELIRLRLECLYLRAKNEFLRFVTWVLGGDPNMEV